MCPSLVLSVLTTCRQLEPAENCSTTQAVSAPILQSVLALKRRKEDHDEKLRYGESKRRETDMLETELNVKNIVVKSKQLSQGWAYLS